MEATGGGKALHAPVAQKSPAITRRLNIFVGNNNLKRLKD
jgi:hypothetical protein